MKIRTADFSDLVAIQTLLNQIGFVDGGSLLQESIGKMLGDPVDTLLVSEVDNRLVAVTSVHFIEDITEAGIAVVTHYSRNGKKRHLGMGIAMEGYITQLTRDRNCHKIEVHCTAPKHGSVPAYNRFDKVLKYLPAT